ncbi:MAG TPA: hypothetical protein PKM38_00525 [Syntrophorhabdaceae bacterium]|jgi:hypothetical protein|nr:hypothetical protein [Syntrophorhabdaceae bacterium]
MPRKKNIYLQEPLFEELKRYICYVCHRWIKKDGLYIGNGVWRHAKCKPKDIISLRDKTTTKSL